MIEEYITRYAQLGDHEKVAQGISSMESEGFLIDTSVMNIHLMAFKYSNNSGIIFNFLRLFTTLNIIYSFNKFILLILF